MKKKVITCYVVLCVIMLQFTVQPSFAANNYTGNWSDEYDIGSYGLNQMNLTMKNKGNKLEIEATNDYYLPINDSRASYLEGSGRYRSSFITGLTTFNAKGTASFKYKDEYNNGQMTISVKNETVTLTWSGKETSDYSFPQGTFKLNKKVNLSNAEIKKMGILLSNLTELKLYNFDAKKVSNSELIRFGIWHNYINNFNSRISSSKGKLYISKSEVEKSILKYFNIKFKNHRSIQDSNYNGKGYIFDGSDGERVFYVKADALYDMGGSSFRISGHLYDPEDPSEDIISRVNATVKKVKTGNEYRYVISKLNVKH
ncbi:hypothetical protein OM416_27755 [Paenibacillus sp. LS1]|uniref:hypothetical protein n=1 Tax=Paenibacillus sp. LS1 TaxID=2992120 RepID=UPI002232158B|nr:hypothetical protein [Paenibacillus sp. LS1]MCW3795408.1 hypothetical protein [Paenibacillus sp. LS1]